MTFGSKNTTGLGSRILDNNNPFASFGLRGITTYEKKFRKKFFIRVKWSNVRVP